MAGLSCKQGAQCWRIAPTKVTQAKRAFRRVAEALVEFPAQAQWDLAEAVSEVMSEREIELRSRIADGRANSAETRPA